MWNLSSVLSRSRTFVLYIDIHFNLFCFWVNEKLKKAIKKKRSCDSCKKRNLCDKATNWTHLCGEFEQILISTEFTQPITHRRCVFATYIFAIDCTKRKVEYERRRNSVSSRVYVWWRIYIIYFIRESVWCAIELKQSKWFTSAIIRGICGSS